ncbi:cellulose biosynthesis cyclic di-GMP-binding regulatory protein BcsB [Devosia sp. WQ 349]|uniref:cellulose biosynthesis cyclic di-GMP-binding regulatory protein BcsB n=1 Tax=Devosia sp. WQ 349K1 TaxID=2800329 RepID=UPI0019051E9F|nr:cellulose biosynthesis cyclic di-GMP-binding regulatory protein BcsB [Devosia sp. WQ 349K1]MBK1795973.1 cellulose biosynthesis cyclic di-GMP-binding regulatory protein BcsB [Devosia sp. WQ 349K1]
MKKLILLTTALLTTTLLSVVAQAQFDMSPESDRVVAAPTPAVPLPTTSADAVLAPVNVSFSRPILPERTFNLAGEEVRRSVVVYLTAEQAAAPASLDLAYLNAVVVAPENSSVKLRINSVEIAQSPIASPSQPSALSFAVPQGILRPGPNVIEFAASQRHRTDCTIASTYELWTDIESTSARLRFEGANLGVIRQLSDLGAVGVDENGTTTLRVISADHTDSRARTALLRLTQQLSLAMRVPGLKVERATELSSEARPGVLDVVVMPAERLPSAVAGAAPQATTGPVAAMIAVQSKANTLVVSGPDWHAIERAGEAIAIAAPGGDGRPRIDLATPHPRLEGGMEISLSELGVETIEFNGRNFSTSLQFDLPADFYAYRYGTLDLVLDAAFSADVEPESEINIYTNGQIASATPLLRTDSGILRNTVMRIPMTNMRPGRNVVDIRVNLLTASDALCQPGWTGQAPTRFVLSNSTVLRMPEFARAASLPNLEVFTGLGWPYSEQPTVPVVVSEGETDLTAAMQLLGRVAAAGDTVLPVEVMSQSTLTPDKNAILVMPLSAMPVSISGRTGISGVSAPVQSPNERALDQFATPQAETSAWRRPADWLSQRLGLNLDDLRIRALDNGPRTISANSAALSQVRQPEGGIWTVLTAADSAVLLEGSERMLVTDNWRKISGRISEVARNADGVEVVPASNHTLVNTQPFSFANMRLVAANWFSGNILFFAGAIMAMGVLLMFATSFVLNAVGRRE